MPDTQVQKTKWEAAAAADAARQAKNRAKKARNKQNRRDRLAQETVERKETEMETRLRKEAAQSADRQRRNSRERFTTSIVGEGIRSPTHQNHIREIQQSQAFIFSSSRHSTVNPRNYRLHVLGKNNNNEPDPNIKRAVRWEQGDLVISLIEPVDMDRTNRTNVTEKRYLYTYTRDSTCLKYRLRTIHKTNDHYDNFQQELSLTTGEVANIDLLLQPSPQES